MTESDAGHTYALKRYALGPQPGVSISREEYESIVASKRRVLDHLAVEELLDLVLGNYEEFERELLSMTLRNATYLGAEDRWTDSIDTIQALGRRVANFLTLAHGYCEQIPHIVSSLFGNPSPELRVVKSYFSEGYDAVLGYRVCTELRKYMQHRGTAVHGCNSQSRWVDRPDGRRVRVCSLAPQTNVRRLQEDARFKSSVMNELRTGGSVQQASGDRMHDLRPFVRDYVSALGRIHLRIRAYVAADAVAHDAIIAAAVERYCAIPGVDSPLGLAAMDLSEQGLLEDRFPVFVVREPIERRQLLAKRNHSPAHFDTQVITNELELS